MTLTTKISKYELNCKLKLVFSQTNFKLIARREGQTEFK